MGRHGFRSWFRRLLWQTLQLGNHSQATQVKRLHATEKVSTPGIAEQQIATPKKEKLKLKQQRQKKENNS
jgi:hypothetical protein